MPANTVLLCMGTRPEIIKMAPVYHALKASSLRPVVLHTGQHSDMAWPLYDFFEMTPDLALDLARERPTLGHLSARLLDTLDEVMVESEAVAMLVHGDTSSTLAAALAAFYAGIPVGHVEAGLRSHNGRDPFPEEKNREIVARLARWHFAPTSRAVGNLMREGCVPKHVHLVGNTIVDAAQRGLEAILDVPEQHEDSDALFDDDMAEWASRGRLVLVTAHRRENWGRPISEVAAAVGALAARHPGIRFLWPLHPNPAVRSAVAFGLQMGGMQTADRIRLSKPLSYPQMLWALRKSWLVMTDSGGIQEEAAALDRPVLVLRKTTERPELIEAGGGALVGTERYALEAWVNELITDEAFYGRMQCLENPYGDGKTAPRIAAILERDLARQPMAPSGMPGVSVVGPLDQRPTEVSAPDVPSLQPMHTVPTAA
ncbi:MAG: UDP-N-acetylglucosamine 2-epimerase (non-hydrolyzing) [Bacteroidota bacterium]